jgi:AmiR/NasT family two-component response regulator
MASIETKPVPTLLVVDDDPLALAAISTILRASAYTICEAHNVHDAILLAQQKKFDLALLDMHMPDMSGLELAQKLEEIDGLPCMFITGSSDKELVRQATDFGAVGYIVKPYDVHQIAPAVAAGLARAIDIRRLRQSESDLSNALRAARETSMAVGLLMGKYHVDRDTAFDILRQYSRSHRSKIHDVAEQLLNASELLSQFHALFKEHMPSEKK